MKRVLKIAVLFFGIVFILPALVSAAVWQADDKRPKNWHQANWNSSGILPAATKDRSAVIYLMAARTGRLKGAFSVHSWIVTKQKNALHYNRYDKVGWGRPVRQNNYAADANWYSNQPEIIAELRGSQAEALIPRLEVAIANYPHSSYGDYHIWPGPNSNSFIAHVLDAVPELGWVAPANAVGRDYRNASHFISVDPDWRNVQLSLGGVFGFSVGRRSGLEMHFLGLVTGIDFKKPGIKLPGFGTIALPM